MERLELECKTYNSERGFGFLYMPDGRRDAFIHCSKLGTQDIESLVSGCIVDCMVRDTPWGLIVEEVFSVTITQELKESKLRQLKTDLERM